MGKVLRFESRTERARRESREAEKAARGLRKEFTDEQIAQIKRDLEEGNHEPTS